MTTLNITSGCDGQSADQFSEGTEIHVRVCNADAARLAVFAEEPVHISVSVDGEVTFASAVAPNQRREFPLSEILRKPRRSGLASSGFKALSIFGRNQPAAPAQSEREPLPDTFSVEVRLGSARGAMQGTYHYRLLPNADFNRQYEGFCEERAPQADKPVFSPDARPATQIILGLPRCQSCGDAISDPIVGCENAECPTHNAS